MKTETPPEIELLTRPCRRAEGGREQERLEPLHVRQKNRPLLRPHGKNKTLKTEGGHVSLLLSLAAAHCEFAVFATFAGWGADAARHPNLRVGTYARRPKIDGFPPATVW